MRRQKRNFTPRAFAEDVINSLILGQKMASGRGLPWLIQASANLAQEYVKKAKLYPTTFFNTPWSEALLDVVEESAQGLRLLHDRTQHLLDPYEGYETGLLWAAELLVLDDLTRQTQVNHLREGGLTKDAFHSVAQLSYILYLVSLTMETAFVSEYASCRRDQSAMGEEFLRYLTLNQFRFTCMSHLMGRFTEDPLVKMMLVRTVPLETMFPSLDSTEETRLITVDGLLSTGNNTFKFNSEVAELFSQTNIMDTPLSDLRMPFDAFQIHTPEQEIAFRRLALPDGNDVWVLDRFDEGVVTLRFTDWDTTVGTAYTRMWEQYQDSGMPADFHVKMQEALHWVVNLALYLATASPIVKAGKRVTKKGELASKAKRRGVSELAVYTTLKHTVEPAITGTGVERGTPNAHWVRGHWKRVRVGKLAQNKTKRIWVQPYLRGEGELPERRIYTDIEA